MNPPTALGAWPCSTAAIDLLDCCLSIICLSFWAYPAIAGPIFLLRMSTFICEGVPTEF